MLEKEHVAAVGHVSRETPTDEGGRAVERLGVRTSGFRFRVSGSGSRIAGFGPERGYAAS
jgi:hypothetical protein